MSSQIDKLYIAATGMITPVGFNTEMTVAAVGAGISAYKESALFNRGYFKMRASWVPDGAFEIPEVNSNKPLAKQSRYKRMLGLAIPALKEVFEKFQSDLAIPLFLGGPELRESGQVGIDEDFITHLAQTSGQNLDLQNSSIFTTGRVSTIEAINHAFDYMEQTGTQTVLVGGVDSYFDPYLLGTLEMERRILAANISDGFAPSEGAGFLLLSSNKSLAQSMFGKSIAINRPGLALEKGHRYSEEPYLGDGLSGAVNNALTGITDTKIKIMFSSTNGESFGAKELGVTMLRNSPKLDQAMNVEHPADSLGDIGAAIGPVLLSMAALSNIQPALVCCSSDGANRAACCLQQVSKAI